MKKEVQLLPIGFRGQPKNKLAMNFHLVYDNHNRRSFTITAPYKNFNAIVNGTVNLPERMKQVFKTLMVKSGYKDMITDGKIYMSFNDYMNFNFKEFKNILINNKFLL